MNLQSRTAISFWVGLALMALGPPAMAQEEDRPLAEGSAREPTGELGLGEALALALTGSPDLAVYNWDIRIAEARRLQASFRPNPELSLEIEEIRLSEGPKSITRSTSFGGGTLGLEREVEDGAPAGFSEAEFTLSLSQLIELGGKRMKRIRAAELEGGVFRWEYEIARANVMAEVASSFTEVLGAQERVRLAGETLALAEDVANAIAARVRAGQVSPIEETRASVQVNQARIELAHEKRNLEAARYLLAVTWGSNTPRFEATVGPLEATGDLISIERLRAKVLESPDLMFWTAELDRREAVATLEKAQRIPDLEVGFGYRTQGLESRTTSRFGLATDPSLLLGRGRTRFDESRNDSFVLQFSLPLPLFHRNQGAIKEAEYQVQKADALRHARGVRIRASLDAVYEILRAAADEVKGLRQEVLPGAESAYEDTNKGYVAGKFGYLDVLDAQRTLVAARSQYLDVLVRYHQARIQVERLAGVDISMSPNSYNEKTEE